MIKAEKKKGSFAESFREGWRALVTLVKMQLKEKMDMGFLRSPKKLITKLFWMLVEFAAVTAVVSVIFHYIKLLQVFSMNDGGLPVSLISFVFGIMLILSLVTDTVGLMKSLYFSKDNTVLLTLPATPSLVFLSKLITYYIYELRKSFMFTLPMFIAFGIIKSYSIIFYPWLLIMFALISFLPVLLAALLSIPSMFVYVFLNRVKVLQYILYAAIGIGSVAFVWYLIGLIPADINFVENKSTIFDDVKTFFENYKVAAAPLYAFTELIVGRAVGVTNHVLHARTLPTLIWVLVLAGVMLALCFLCSKPLFCRMASTPFEFKKKNNIKAKRNVKRSPFISAVKKEFTIGLRSNFFIKFGGVVIVVMPIAIYLINKIYSAMNTKLLGAQMATCFNVLIILLILMMNNIDMASIYSRDGSSSYLNKIQPTPPIILLFSKLFFPMVMSLIGTVLTVNIFAIESSLKPVDAIMIGVTVYCIYLGHLFASVESDIMNPQYEQYATFNEQANNPNESKAGVTLIVLAFIVFILALFLSYRMDQTTWVKIGIVSVLFAVLKIITFSSKIKAFYREKQ